MKWDWDAVNYDIWSALVAAYVFLEIALIFGMIHVWLGWGFEMVVSTRLAFYYGISSALLVFMLFMHQRSWEKLKARIWREKK